MFIPVLYFKKRFTNNSTPYVKMCKKYFLFFHARITGTSISFSKAIIFNKEHRELREGIAKIYRAIRKIFTRYKVRRARQTNERHST